MTTKDKILAPLHEQIRLVSCWPNTSEKKAMEELLRKVEQETSDAIDKVMEESKNSLPVLHLTTPINPEEADGTDSRRICLAKLGVIPE